jgi:hypothetical protein
MPEHAAVVTCPKCGVYAASFPYTTMLTGETMGTCYQHPDGRVCFDMAPEWESFTKATVGNLADKVGRSDPMPPYITSQALPGGLTAFQVPDEPPQSFLDAVEASRQRMRAQGYIEGDGKPIDRVKYAKLFAALETWNWKTIFRGMQGCNE